MRGDAGTGASGSRRGPKVALGMLGAVALIAATAVVALANYATGLTLTGKCFDTYTSGTLVTQDAQTATPPHSVTLEILASQNGGSTYPYFVARRRSDPNIG